MASSSEEIKILESAVAGLPEIAEIIVSTPANNRAKAFDAVEGTYLQTARDLGGAEKFARRWASAIMLQLRAEVEERTLARRKLLTALHDELLREIIGAIRETEHRASDDVCTETIENDIQQILNQTYGLRMASSSN